MATLAQYIHGVALLLVLPEPFWIFQERPIFREGILRRHVLCSPQMNLEILVKHNSSWPLSSDREAHALLNAVAQNQ